MPATALIDAIRFRLAHCLGVVSSAAFIAFYLVLVFGAGSVTATHNAIYLLATIGVVTLLTWTYMHDSRTCLLCARNVPRRERRAKRLGDRLPSVMKIEHAMDRWTQIVPVFAIGIATFAMTTHRFVVAIVAIAFAVVFQVVGMVVWYRHAGMYPHCARCQARAKAMAEKWAKIRAEAKADAQAKAEKYRVKAEAKAHYDERPGDPRG